MSWGSIVGHEGPLDRFRKSLEHDRLASTYLFVGPEGIGKRAFALKLAEAILCETNGESSLDPCGICPACQQVQAQTHPDLILIGKPKDKAYIPIELLIGDKEHRRREGLCHDIGLKPFRGGRKIAIIDDADFFNVEGANCLLKTLEEPPPNSLLILIGTSEKRQLKTIVSRSQVVRFNVLDKSQVLEVLGRNPFEDQDVDLEFLANVSGGSVQRAFALADPESREFRKNLFRQLGTRDPGADNFAQAVTDFVDAAGKDAAKKRTRLAFVGDLTISFFRESIVRLTLAASQSVDDSLSAELERFCEYYQADPIDGAEIAGRCIERTIEMQRQVYANAGQAVIVDAWLNDLGKISRRESAIA